MFKFATTAEAINLANSQQSLINSSGSRSHWNSPHVRVMAEFVNNLDKIANEAGAGFDSGDILFFQRFMEKVIPIWRDKVVHDDFSGYTGQPYLINQLDFANNLAPVSYSTNAKHMLGWVFISLANPMLTDAYEQDISEETFDLWVTKVTNWIFYFSSPHYVRSIVWSADYDLDVLRKFKADRWVYTRMEVLEFILNKNHAPEQVYAFGVEVAKVCSPEGLTYLSSVSSPKVVKSLVGLKLSNREPFTEDILKRLVEVGFESSAEVKNYARKFGVGWNDNDFFTRLINAKTLYPDLNAYTPAV